MVRPSITISMISLRPPTAATGTPAPSAFASTVRSGRMPNSSCAPPGATRIPVSTSSKISTAPCSVASSRMRSR